MIFQARVLEWVAISFSILLLDIREIHIKRTNGTSLVVQWLRIHLPVQGTWVLSLIGELRSHMPLEKPTCHNEDQKKVGGGARIAKIPKVGEKKRNWNFHALLVGVY